MLPSSYYDQQCQNQLIIRDDEQVSMLSYLDRLYEELIQENQQRKRFFSKWRKPCLITGIYLWGGVGIGKTFLLDCLYTCLPFSQKLRLHFHAFMKWVHAELAIHQGHINPLQRVAKKIAEQYQVLCFDEFVVTDIADAMILARLLEALFAYGVCLITTSNTEPDYLYLKGLQRPLFLPAISLIKKHTTVLHTKTITDYRLQYLKNARHFYTPNDVSAENNLEKYFSLLTHDEEIFFNSIEIENRLIPIKKRTLNVIWFDFNVICNIPRSQQDYLALVQQYHTIFISNISRFSMHSKNTISLFIRLIDILYDARIRLICSAETEIDALYPEGNLQAEFLRTRSRLLEMQTENYFANANFLFETRKIAS